MGKDEATEEIPEEETKGKYAKMYDTAVEGNKISEATSTIWKPDTEGERLIGKVVKIAPFEEGAFDAEVKMYLVETDNGLVSTVLGSATDKQLDKWDLEGKLIAITYHGKKQLQDGKQVNNYQVQVF